MEPKFNINTSQNVNIELKIAGVGDRLVAVLIDSLVLGAASMVIMLFASLVSFSESFNIVVFSIYGFVILFYHFFMEWLFNGQTIGKKIRGIKVIHAKGTSAGVFQLLIRNLIRVVDSIYGFGLLIIFFTKKSQRLGDLAANTIVVKTNDNIELKDTALKQVSDDYQPSFGKVEILRLDEKDMEMIKELINRPTMKMNWKLVALLEQKIKAKTGIESSLVALEFLKKVLSDFQYYAGMTS